MVKNGRWRRYIADRLFRRAALLVGAHSACGFFYVPKPDGRTSGFVVSNMSDHVDRPALMEAVVALHMLSEESLRHFVSFVTAKDEPPEFTVVRGSDICEGRTLN